MPFDAVFLTALARELRAEALGCRIDRVHQPERDALVLQLRSRDGVSRLLLCASPNHPRAHFTQAPMENPAQLQDVYKRQPSGCSPCRGPRRCRTSRRPAGDRRSSQSRGRCC